MSLSAIGPYSYNTHSCPPQETTHIASVFRMTCKIKRIVSVTSAVNSDCLLKYAVTGWSVQLRRIHYCE